MHEPRVEGGDIRREGGEACEQLCDTESGECRCAGNLQHESAAPYFLSGGVEYRGIGN